MFEFRSEVLRVALSATSAGGVVCVRLSGIVDPTAADGLAHVLVQLRNAAAPHTVVVDVAEVTFACSTLVNFLARLRRALPAGTVIAVDHPAPIIRRLLAVAGLHWVVLPEESPLADGSRSATAPPTMWASPDTG